MKYQIKIFVYFLTISVFSSMLGQPAYSQISLTNDTKTNEVEIPEDLTKEDIRDLVSKLSDQQVRDILLQRLDTVADEQEKLNENEKSLIEFITDALVNVGISIVAAFNTLPLIFDGIKNGLDAIKTGAGFSGVMKFFIGLGAAVFAGLAAGKLVDFILASRRKEMPEEHSASLGQSIKILSKRLGFDLLKVALFAAVAFGVMLLVYGYKPPLPLGWGLISTVGVITLIMASVARFNLAPKRPELRLLNMSDDEASKLYRYSVMAGFLIGIFVFFTTAREAMNIEAGKYRIGFWLNFLLHAFFMYTLYMSRNGIIQAMIGRDGLVGPMGVRLAQLWPYIAIVFTGISWIVVEAIAGLGRFDLISNGQNYWMLLLIAFVPVYDTALRGLISHLTPPPIGDGLIAERAHVATLACYVRAGRVILIAILLVVIAGIWGVSFVDIDSDDFGTRIASRVLDGIFVFIIGYLLWELVGVLINRRLAKEHGDAGIDIEQDEPGGGEGGGAGLSRLATILPILKLALQTTIIVMAILLGLNRLGVDITPLLAGAGIVGLAIGFGAQTLVKDVVSGMFFLADDAFRVGEYLEIGTTVGTVERISIRSLQLRHHQGPIHTIPYGEIPQVTNNSRDWVIMKMKFTFPFDTDANKIKKLFKRVGAEMLEADYADDIIQTFKSQGVYDVDDVGIVIRGKFMAKPGTQWIIRKDVYNRVQKVLDEAGIQFARKEVRVQIPGVDSNSELNAQQKEAIGAAVSEVSQNEQPAAKK